MSAFIVDKKHIDLLVAAADHYGRAGYQGSKMQWWQVDENGEYAGWRYLATYEDTSTEELYTLSQLGQILVSENVASVGHRYSEPGRVVYYGAEAAAGMDDLDPAAGDLPGPCDAYYMAPYVYDNPGRILSPGEVLQGDRLPRLSVLRTRRVAQVGSVRVPDRATRKGVLPRSRIRAGRLGYVQLTRA